MAVVCPFCESDSVRVVPRKRRPDVFLPRAPRKCSSCKAIFVPPFSLVMRMVIVLTGIAFITFGVIDIIVPAMKALFSEGQIGARTILSVLFYAWAILYMAWIMCIAGMTREPVRL